MTPLSTYTNPLSDAVRSEIRSRSFEALEQDNREACGFVLDDDTVVEVPNTAQAPADRFEITAEASAQYLDRARCVWHSHRSLARFSPADHAACKALGLPWAMYCTRDNTHHWLDPAQDAGLVGRPWAWGVHDCYAAVRDFFWQQHCIEMGDYERRGEGVWSASDFREFEDNWASEGFEPIAGEPRNGDVLLFRIRNEWVNHVGVLVDVNRNQFLHHSVDRFSEINVLAWDGFWGNQIARIVRHRDLA